MKSTAMHDIICSLSRVAAVISLGCASMAAQAEIYKIVGPDGKVTFSDKPPAAAAAPKLGSPAPGADDGAMPPALRKSMGDFPVRLITQARCAPCDAGRAWLKSRGIPFTERTVQSQDDTAALLRINDKGTLPVLTLGSQVLSGYNNVEWARYLDAAGYPQKSALPKTYEYPAPSALAPKAAAGGASSGSPEASEPEDPPIEAPKGIRF